MADSSWALLRAHHQKNIADINSGLVGPWAPLAASYGSKNMAFCDATVEPARLLIHRGYGYRDESHKSTVVALWFDHDPAMAVAHLVAATSLDLDWTEEGYRIVEADDRRLERGTWYALRQLVKGADAAARKLAEKAASKFAKDASFVNRCALSLAFPHLRLLTDEERHHGAYVPYGDADFASDLYILACLGDSPHVDAVIGTYDTDPEALPEFLGDDAIAPLRASLLQYSGADRTKGIMKVLTAFEHPRAADACARLLHEHHAMAGAIHRLRQDPAQGIDALARWVGELELAPKKLRARFIEAPREALHALVRAHRDLARASKVTAEARSAVDAALEATKALPEAPRLECLARLAWNQKKKKKAKAGAKKKKTKTKAVKPELLPYEERMHWGKEGPPKTTRHSGSKPDEEFAESIAESSYRSLMVATWMTAEGARKILGEYEPKEWYAQEDDVESMMHLLGFDALPAMLGVTRRLSGTLVGLAGVESPRVAPSMAHAYANLAKVKGVGEAWLLKFPDAAIVGLIPELFSKGKALKAAEAALHLLAETHRPLVEATAAKYGEDSRARIEALLAQDTSPLAAFVKAPRIPAFCKPEMLPPPMLKDGKAQLGPDDVRDLVSVLAVATPGESLAPIEAVRAACEEASLAHFSWSLFQQWLAYGAPMKNKWPFFALAHFGDAAAARELGALAKAWAPGGFPSRAQLAIEVLAAMGSDVAMLEIYKTAERVRSRALAARAKKTLARIAKERGLTMVELTDRLVPDLGLDDDGTTTLDFGESRSFLVRFDETLKPYLIGADGKRLKTLPKANKRDDEGMVDEAKATWKMLKKEARSIASERITKMERAMCSGRVWSRDEFLSFFATHPLILNLARRLVWRSQTTPALDFRCTADGTFANIEDEEIELPLAAVGLPHPSQIDDKERARWGDTFVDYELHPPFDQLSRATYSTKSALAQVEAALRAPIATTSLLALLRRGWNAGPAEQGGRVFVYERSLGAEHVSLLFEPGIQLGDPAMEPSQAVKIHARRDEEARALEDLDVILLSEVARDLSAFQGS